MTHRDQRRARATHGAGSRGSLFRSGPASPRDLFVGREAELQRLASAVIEACAGRGRVALVGGDAGIGKTRLLEEAERRAAADGLRVLRGRCQEQGGTPPYWPWRQALGQLAADSDPAVLRTWLGARADVVATMIDHLHDILGPLAAPPPLDNPEAVRFRLHDAVSGWLRAAANDQPLLLVLDDLHWADRGSLKLLEFLCHELPAIPLLLLGTYRSYGNEHRHPLQHTLGELVREPSCEQIMLGGLEEPDVARLIELTAGRPPPVDLVTALCRRTAGNPLYIAEIVRLLDQEGSLQSYASAAHPVDWSTVPLPPSVTAAISRRLEPLSSRCRTLLQVAALIGRQLDLQLLAELTGESLTEVMTVADEACGDRLLEEDPAATGTYRFSHPLIQEALGQELGPSLRAPHHATIATALEARYGDRSADHASELAHHLACAQPLASAEKVVRYSLLAGEQALASQAYGAAAAHFQAGLAAKNGSAASTTGAGPGSNHDQATDDAETAHLRFGLARSLPRAQSIYSFHFAFRSTSAPGVVDAWHQLEAAYDYFERTGDVANAIVVAEYPLLVAVERELHATEPIEWDGMRGDLMGTGAKWCLADRALKLAEPGTHLHARVLWLAASAGYYRDDDYAAAAAGLQRTLEVARREGDSGLELQALASWLFVAADHELCELASELGAQVIDLARSLGDPLMEVAAAFRSYLACLSLHRHDRASACVDIANAGTRRLRWPLEVGLLAEVEVAWLRGNWQAARAASDRALAAPRDHTTYRQHLAVRARLEHTLGSRRAGDRLLRRYLTELERAKYGTSVDAMELALLARLTGNLTLLDVALEAAHAARGFWRSRAWMAMSVIAYLRQDRSLAARVAGFVRGFPPGSTWAPPRLELTLDVHRGQLEVTLGELDTAIASFARALDYFRDAGAADLLGWTCHDCAQALLARDGAGDRERAAALIDEGLAVSRGAGLRPLARRLQALALGNGRGTTTADGVPDGLSAREVEVLGLLAAGLRNKQIAHELSISPKTVANHVQRIFAKTGAGNRAEAAAYAVRAALAEAGSREHDPDG